MDQSYFFRKTSFLNRRQQIWGVSKCCWLLDLQWLCFLKSPPCKPYLKRRRHTEYRGKKGSLKLDTCFKAWYFLYRKTDLHQIWTKKDEFIIAGYISSAKSVYQISICSGQVKGLLRYHCLHCLIVSWQGWSTGISRSQLAGTTINWETLILLWFFQKKKKKPAVMPFQVSTAVLRSQMGQRSRMTQDLKHGFKEGNARIYRLYFWCYWTKRIQSQYALSVHHKIMDITYK